MGDPKLVTRTAEIDGSITGNNNFPPPIPALEVVQDKGAAFSLALTNCKTGDRVMIAIKNQKRTELIEALHLLGDYVLYTSNGDAVIAKSSGFTVAKKASPRSPIEKPKFYKVVNGNNPGELISKGATVKNAVAYNHQYADDENMALGIWTSVPSSKATCVLSGLKSGVFYNCRMEVLGVKGQVVYSDIQRIRVL